MTGIIFEVTGNKTIVMKNGGGFVELPTKQGWQAGDVVTLPKTMPARRIIALATSVAACLALVFVTLFIYLGYAQGQYAVISIDINPSIEMSVNRFGKVVSVRAYNDQGGEILNLVDVNGMSYLDAASRLIASDAMAPYLAQKAFLVFSVQAGDEGLQRQMLAGLQGAADEYVYAHHQNAAIEYFPIDSQTLEAAHKNGVTAGKYMMLLELESVAPQLDISQYAYHDVCDIQTEIDTHRGHGMDGERQHHFSRQQDSSVAEPAQNPADVSSAVAPDVPPEESTSQSSPLPATPDNGGHGNGHGGHE